MFGSRELAFRIDRFAYDLDYFEYMDALSGDNENFIRDIENMLLDGNTEPIIRAFKELDDEKLDKDMVIRKREILKDIEKFTCEFAQRLVVDLMLMVLFSVDS